MQTLQEVQKSFISIGYSPKLKPFNQRVLAILAIIFVGVVLEFIYLIHDADGAQELMESIYIITATAGSFLCFASSSFIMEEIFAFIDSSNETFRESK